MLVDIDGTLCAMFPGLATAPLSVKKMLWEAYRLQYEGMAGRVLVFMEFKEGDV
jgi:hypothetical protein